MANQFDSQIGAFAGNGSGLHWLLISVVAALCLLVVLIASVVGQNWLVAAVAFIGLVAAVIGAVRGFLAFQAGNTTGGAFELAVAQPEIQRQNLGIEVVELSKILDVAPDQLNDLQSAYIVAEDLALRQIQQDEDLPLLRHIRVARTHFSAAFIKGDIFHCVEVFFLVVPELRQEKIDAAIRKVRQVKKAFSEKGSRLRVRLMIVLVTQLTEADDARLREALKKHRFSENPVDTDIRLLDFESLQRIFVTE